MADNLPSVYEFEHDISNAEAPNPIPLGEYRASVRSVEPGVGKESGKPNVKLTYHISPDQYPADFTDGSPDGEMINVWQGLDASDAKSRYRLRLFGDMHGVAITNRLDVNEFIGTEVIMQITHEEYNGVNQARGRVVRSA